MYIEAIKTHRIHLNESLFDVLDCYLPLLQEGSLIAVTSKIISLSQGRVVSKETCSKEDLIRQEADAVAETTFLPYGIFLTIKNNILIPSAGIDDSNSEGNFILYPQDLQKTAASLWSYVRAKHNLKSLGILITDSHTTPLRRGVTGIALGWCGFEPLYSYIEKPDIYENPLRVTQANLLDGLAAAAVLVMGEGNEQTPLALITNAPKMTFLSRPPTLEEEATFSIPMEDDLYAPLLMNTSWVRSKVS
jgi:putative folate metabolism gamma-glutamate ligase